MTRFLTLKRLMRHLKQRLMPIARFFPNQTMRAIEEAIAQSERKHAAQLCFIVENDYAFLDIWHGVTPRQRALSVFSQYRIWDTEQNNGVLIYLSLADRDIEIVADRGVDRAVPDFFWQDLMREVQTYYRQQAFEAGTLFAIQSIGQELERLYPAQVSQANELANSPIVL